MRAVRRRQPKLRLALINLLVQPPSPVFTSIALTFGSFNVAALSHAVTH